ncbi:hypothetical protein [Armatimonas sp.]|uniref:hypothetical protein n=1 Tax=Armatimonas sp. TaxID=1872638 RepID=UPI003753302E
MAEFISIALLLLGVIALCQPFDKSIFANGLHLLFWGWLGLNIFSHRKPVR